MRDRLSASLAPPTRCSRPARAGEVDDKEQELQYGKKKERFVAWAKGERIGLARGLQEALEEAHQDMLAATDKNGRTAEDLKPWSKRQFVLVGGLALYYKADKCRGAVYLRGAVIKARRHLSAL